MSNYASQARLVEDPAFIGRNRAVTVEQSGTPGVGDTNPATSALSAGIVRDDGPYTAVFTTLAAAGPGMADKATGPNGEVDQSKITDADLLSLTQANYPRVSTLYFSEDGSPL